MSEQKGLLLVHGFSGHPSDMEWVGSRFEKLNWKVRIVRLAGHDSSLDAFEASNWIEWYDSVCRAWTGLSASSRHVTYLGLSTGAVLGLRLATVDERPPDTLVTINAPLKLNDWRMPYAGLLRKVMRYIPAGPRDIENPAVRAKNSGLDRVPVRAAWQLQKLLEDVGPRLARVRCPLLALHSRVDHTVAPENTREIFERVSSSKKKLYQINKGWHVATLDDGRAEIVEQIQAFLKT